MENNRNELEKEMGKRKERNFEGGKKGGNRRGRV